MNPIEACLAMLKNLPDSKNEIRRVKILIACYDWTESKQIAKKAGLKCLTNNGALTLKQQGFLERKHEYKLYGTHKRLVYLYKTTPKGIELITKLLK
jgi:hypothetical protein